MRSCVPKRYELTLLLFLSMLLALASSCAEETYTQVVVVMDTDYQVPSEVDRIRARVLKVSEDGLTEKETWSEEFPLVAGDAPASGLYSLPASFSVVPDKADLNREIVVEARALIGDEPVVTRTVRTGFVPGQFRVLRMFLYRECADATCPDGSSCGCPGAGSCVTPSCVDEYVDPEGLEVTSDPGVLPPDPGIPEGCGSGLTSCAGECVDTVTDPRFCGGCNDPCPNGMVCADSQCVDPTDCRAGSTTCEGFTYCDDATGECLRGCAVDEQCGSDETCDAATHECICKPELVRCPPEIGDCVDTNTDLAYCGDCKTSCPRNNVCSEGLCVDLGDCRFNGIGCTGFSYCDESSGECVRGCLLDEQCGAANEVCDTEINDCVCDGGFQRCPPVAGDCVDTQTDLTYCGDCDTSCTRGEVCQDGVCFNPDCNTNGIGCSGFTYCDQDTGECLPGCDSNAQCTNANQRCNVSTHTCVCKSGFTRCGLQCVDTKTDPTHCGNCTTTCASGEVCQDSVCFNPDCNTNGIGCSGFTYCDETTGECLPGCGSDAQCTSANERCNVSTHTCVCKSGFTRCGLQCVDTKTDPQYCGNCNTTCTSGEVCQDSVCFNPDCNTNGIGCSGFTYCDQVTGECLPGCDSDVQCTNANERCNVSTHTCVCTLGLTRCEGTCVNLLSDRQNCGVCTNSCKGNESCVLGQCLGPGD